MAELVLDGARMDSVASSLRSAGGGSGPSCPSVTYCGSDGVTDAFARAFGVLRDQEENTRAGWLALAARADRAVAVMLEADAALAGSLG